MSSTTRSSRRAVLPPPISRTAPAAQASLPPTRARWRRGRQRIVVSYKNLCVCCCLRFAVASDHESHVGHIDKSVCFRADRGKDKSQVTTKPVNKANSAAAKVTTSNGNGALNRWAIKQSLENPQSAQLSGLVCQQALGESCCIRVCRIVWETLLNQEFRKTNKQTNASVSQHQSH